MTSLRNDADGDDASAPAAVTAVAWQRLMTSHDDAPYLTSATCRRCSACTEN